MDLLVLKIVNVMYILFNSGRILSYLPQIYAVAKEKTPVNAISLITWLFWTLANLTTGLYAQLIVKDTLLALMSYGNTFGCLAVVCIVLFKRKKYEEKMKEASRHSLLNQKLFVPKITNLTLEDE